MECQKIWQIECQKICQIECQIECQKVYQIECQMGWVQCHGGDHSKQSNLLSFFFGWGYFATIYLPEMAWTFLSFLGLLLGPAWFYHAISLKDTWKPWFCRHWRCPHLILGAISPLYLVASFDHDFPVQHFLRFLNLQSLMTLVVGRLRTSVWCSGRGCLPHPRSLEHLNCTMMGEPVSQASFVSLCMVARRDATQQVTRWHPKHSDIPIPNLSLPISTLAIWDSYGPSAVFTWQITYESAIFRPEFDPISRDGRIKYPGAGGLQDQAQLLSALICDWATPPNRSNLWPAREALGTGIERTMVTGNNVEPQFVAHPRNWPNRESNQHGPKAWQCPTLAASEAPESGQWLQEGLAKFFDMSEDSTWG